jgi:glucose-1-phosphate thymidylyltransferase
MRYSTIQMKGVLICGGLGTRLRPLTEVTNKSLLPVYDQPLIFYPLQVLLHAGIQEIMVISGPEHIDQMTTFLGSGSNFGAKFAYRVQDEPKGIAQALGMAESFAAGDSVCAILGDNVYFNNLSSHIQNFQSGGHVFLKEVPDPQRFGVAEMQGDKVVSVVEKPKDPTSNLAITGCYVYDNRCFDVIKTLKPSGRDELEITDVTKWYLEQGELNATVLSDEWIDAGTFESLHKASSLVRERKLKILKEKVEQTAQQV